MSQHRIKLPKYLRKIDDLIQSTPALKTPGVHHISVKHDDWCLIFKGGQCNCNPDVEYLGLDQ